MKVKGRKTKKNCRHWAINFSHVNCAIEKIYCGIIFGRETTDVIRAHVHPYHSKL